MSKYESQVDISQLADAKIVNILNNFVYKAENNKINK
jgi:hypothetical protein